MYSRCKTAALWRFISFQSSGLYTVLQSVLHLCLYTLYTRLERPLQTKVCYQCGECCAWTSAVFSRDSSTSPGRTGAYTRGSRSERPLVRCWRRWERPEGRRESTVILGSVLRNTAVLYIHTPTAVVYSVCTFTQIQHDHFHFSL